MVVCESPSFGGVYAHLSELMRVAPRVDNDRWQGVDVRGNPAARMYELADVVVSVDLGEREDLGHWRADCAPNLPWADDHFAERVSGQPLNPGKEWANWPWRASADKFRRPDERFNHSYMERMWPKYARLTPGGVMPVIEGRGVPRRGKKAIMGVDRPVGDLLDLVDLLVRDPYTRQAYLPLFFPEDTGWGDGGRKMCSLGYHFLRRGDHLSVFYPMRSCDLVRHFRDDCYLCVRLFLWVLDQCRERDGEGWAACVPGGYSMWVTSLHLFENDRIKLLQGKDLG